MSQEAVAFPDIHTHKETNCLASFIDRDRQVDRECNRNVWKRRGVHIH